MKIKLKVIIFTNFLDFIKGITTPKNKTSPKSPVYKSTLKSSQYIYFQEPHQSIYDDRDENFILNNDNNFEFIEIKSILKPQNQIESIGLNISTKPLLNHQIKRGYFDYK